MSSFTSPDGLTALGSSMRTSSAKDSLRPLCGVAEARMSASVLRASRSASRWFIVAVLVTLWDSSMTTASQRWARRCGMYWSDLRSEEHTSELQSRFDLVCRLLLEKKKNKD